MDLLIQNASEVVTCTGDAASLGVLPGAVVGVTQGRVSYVGPASGLPGEAARVIDAEGGFVGPGFVDPHTHLVFAGDRAGEFAQRNAGAGYLEIANAGGGIMNTVRATRAASEQKLAQLALPRLARLLEQGVTTAEVKSGYGLSLSDELKMLRTIQRLGDLQAMELVPTLLCAHAVPEEFKDLRQEYLRLCAEEILPAVAKEKLAVACDVFCEAGAFTVEESRALLTAAAKLGLRVKLHAEQLSLSGGAALAAELGALSADHLEQVDGASIQALANAKVTAVLVPVASLFLRVPAYAPGRALRDGGVNVALGTNVNPGSAMSENVSLTLGLACLQNGLTPSEAYWGMTRGGALALGRPELGTIQVGAPADLVVFGCAQHGHLPYHLGVNHAQVVIKSGQVVSEPSGALCR